MIEGLWTMQYISSQGSMAAGVLVLVGGKLFGGDANYYLTGEYDFEDGTVRAHICVSNYSGKFQSIFGTLDECELRVTGELKGAIIEGHGAVAGNEAQGVSVIMRRRAPLSGGSGACPAREPDGADEPAAAARPKAREGKR